MFPDPGRSLAEIRRVLRPGRTVGLSIFGDGDARWDAVRDRLFANPPPPEKRWTTPLLPFRNADDLRAGLEVSGFVDVRVQQEVSMQPMSTGTSGWRGLGRRVIAERSNV